MKRLAKIAVEYEAEMWRSLFRWLLRRPVTTEPAARPFGYGRAATPVLGVFIGLSAIEIPILDLLLPWTTVRIIVALLGAYGLLWMIGLLAMIRVKPHIVAPSGLRLRGTFGPDITIPWDYIETIRVSKRTLHGKDRQYDRSGPRVAYSLGVVKGTDVDVVFRHPTTVELPTGETEPLGELRIAADEPAALVAAARAFILTDAPKTQLSGHPMQRDAPKTQIPG